MYTIKSESAEGIYYLCNYWNNNKTFWITKNKLTDDKLFKSVGLAKRSLKRLLKIMPDYLEDKFTLVLIDNNKNIVELTDLKCIPVHVTKSMFSAIKEIIINEDKVYE